MIDTRKVTGRRTLRFDSMDDLLADVEGLDRQRDRVVAKGNWSPGQIVEHVAIVIDASMDGVDIKVPFFIRWVAPLVKKRVLRDTIRPGFTLPPNMHAFMPREDVTWAEAVEHLRRTVGRSKSEPMTQRSPAFGRMSHEEWEKLHCRHAEMHFSFLEAS